MIGIQEPNHLKIYKPLRLSEFDAEYTILSISLVALDIWHQHHNSRKLTREQHGSEAFVACLTKFYRNYPRQDCSSQNEVELEHCVYIMQCSWWNKRPNFFYGINPRCNLFRQSINMSLPSQIFVDEYTERFERGDTIYWNIINRELKCICINIKSVLVAFKVSLLEVSHLFKLLRS